MAVKFHERLRQRRIEAGLSQPELAKKADLSTSSVSNYERGARRPDIDDLARLAAALGTTSAELLDESDAGSVASSGITPMPSKVVDEFRARGGRHLSAEEKASFRSRLSEELERKRAERLRLERIQQLAEEERELEKLKSELETHRDEENE